MEKNESILYLNNVSVSFDGFKAINELSLYIEFRKETYVGELKIVGDSIESNNKQYYNVSYSTSNESYSIIKPSNRRFSSGENYTSIGRNVRSIKVSFIKQKADVIDSLNKRYLYNFSLDLSKGKYWQNSGISRIKKNLWNI